MQLLNLVAVLINDLNRPLGQLIVRNVQLIQRMNLFIGVRINIEMVHVDKHALKALICDLVVNQVKNTQLGREKLWDLVEDCVVDLCITQLQLLQVWEGCEQLY